MIKTVQFRNAAKFIDSLIKDNQRCLLLFSGDKQSNDKSWCPDCNEISHLVQQFKKESVKFKIPFYVVLVGQRNEWKDRNNIYRVNKSIRISSVPTLGLFQQNTMIKRFDKLQQIKQAKFRQLLFEGLKAKPNL